MTFKTHIFKVIISNKERKSIDRQKKEKNLKTDQQWLRHVMYQFDDVKWKNAGL